MKQYLNLMKQVVRDGVWQDNRTGIKTKMIPGAILKFDMEDGFPLITTRKAPIRNIIGELLAFLRGYTSAKYFRDLGCKFWDANANENEAWLKNPNRKGIDDLGRVYGAQWTDWTVIPSRKHGGVGMVSSINQIDILLDTIHRDPTSRRLLVTAWRPDEISQMALPPCHYGFQVIIEQESKKMHLLWNQR